MGASVGWRCSQADPPAAGGLLSALGPIQASRPSHWHDTPGRRDCLGVRRATILSLRSAYSTYNGLDLSGFDLVK